MSAAAVLRCSRTAAFPRCSCKRHVTACLYTVLRVQKLRVIPSNVDEFVALMTAMTSTQEVYEGMMERKEFVQDLYLLMAEQRIHVSVCVSRSVRRSSPPLLKRVRCATLTRAGGGAVGTHHAGRRRVAAAGSAAGR